MDRVTYVSTATQRRVARANSGQFKPTILITEEARVAISKGEVVVRRGQWLIDGFTGKRGQYLALKKTMFGKPNIRIREAKPGMTFKDYQAKLAA